MRIIIIRHGDPNYEIDGLTPRGELEVRALAEKMKNEEVAAIYCSTLGRARLTAQPTADALGLRVEPCEWLRDYNHPALIGWCPFNETWDVDGRQQDNGLIRAIYEYTKTIDPVRPCIDTSGNYHVVTDIYDIHDYNQNVEVYRKRYAEITDTEIFENYGTRQKYNGKPYFISEYGGIKWAAQMENSVTSWGYGNSPKTVEEYVARYVGLTDTLINTPKVCGLCYTQLYDVEQEQNGIYYFDRTPKFSEEVMDQLAAVMKQKAAIED